MGDGGCCGDPFDQAQDTTTLSGALLRLNIDSPDFDRGSVYSIPVDNPFVMGGGAPEVFAFGLRNGWRFSFDRLEGSIWLGDVGESRREEINRIAAGLNYGWPFIEGTRCSEGEGCDQSGLIEPIVDYGRSLGASVTGGFVYRGDELDSYQGRYFFADFVSGLVMSFDTESEEQPEIRSEWDSSHFIVSFAESPQGELYLVAFSRSYEGQLFKLVRRPSAAETPPALLSETGLFDPLDLTRGRSGSIAFKPQAALWSDGANKERFMILPEDGRIAVAESGHLDLPLETALVKHFDYDNEIHETRIFRRSAEGWVGASYRWKDDRSDAELLLDGLETSLDGGRLWSYPSTSQCKQCHTSVAGRSLGLTASQIDFPFDAGIGDGVRNQLERLHDAGRFEESIDLIKVQEFTDLSDPLGAGDLARRARSYLQANCAHCHQPAGPTPSRIDLRFSTETSQMGICDVEPQRGDLGIADPQLRILSPGRPDLSVLLLRMDRRDSFQMPPLGTYLIDDEAVQMLRSWIESIEDCDD
ncbi:MAG: hypothetical protein CL917_02550 [Deltaproteobacteria bacterium]|nr:hypothetical protein [Deltaproteobacteria bacterium]